MDKVVFLDRDGTINIEKNYLYKKEDFEFIENVPLAIHLLNKNKYKVIIVSNQAGVGKGYYTEADVRDLHCYISECLRKHNAYIDDYLYCPHHIQANIDKYRVSCECRKPGIGMFLEVEKNFMVDKANSWMIGDNEGDILAGNNYGINTALVSTGYGEQVCRSENKTLTYQYYAKDLLDAVMYILEKGKNT